jgi:hypothetical protein
MAIKANPAYYLLYKSAEVSLVKTGKRDEALKRFEGGIQQWITRNDNMQVQYFILLFGGMKLFR